MKHLKDSLVCLLLVAVIALSVKAFIFLDHLGKTVVAVRGDVAQVMYDVHDSTVKVNATLDDSRKLISTTTSTVKAARGTIEAARPKILISLDDSHHLLLEAGLTAAEARKASVEQRAYWAKTSQDTDALVRNLNAFVDSANKTTLQVNKAVADADAVISDPAIPSTMKHADKILADGEKVADRFAKPASAVKAGFTWVLDRVAHFLK